MKTLHPSSQYKRDIKRYRNSPAKIAKLMELLRTLQAEKPIPEIHRPHMLTGDYAGCMGCHIESDFLLVWFDPQTNQIDLLRLGSHSEPFGKNKRR